MTVIKHYMALKDRIDPIFVSSPDNLSMDCLHISGSGRSYTEEEYEKFSQEHYMNTKENGSIFCRLCKVVLRSNLRRHFLNRHAVRTRHYSCPACNRIYDNKHCFDSHISYSHPELRSIIRTKECEVIANGNPI